MTYSSLLTIFTVTSAPFNANLTLSLVVYSLESIGQLKVRLGEHDVSTTDEPTEHEERSVEKVRCTW